MKVSRPGLGEVCVGKAVVWEAWDGEEEDTGKGEPGSEVPPALMHRCRGILQ